MTQTTAPPPHRAAAEADAGAQTMARDNKIGGRKFNATTHDLPKGAKKSGRPPLTTGEYAAKKSRKRKLDSVKKARVGGKKMDSKTYSIDRAEMSQRDALASLRAAGLKCRPASTRFEGHVGVEVFGDASAQREAEKVLFG